MKLFNYIIEANLRARHPWSHFKVHKYDMYKHLVWGRLSLLWGQPHLVEIEVHRGCGAEVHGVGEDGISYCTGCDTIVEGDTEYITMEEFENA